MSSLTDISLFAAIFDSGQLVVPAIVIAAVIALAIALMAIASRYKTVPPNAIGVFYGRSYKYTDSEGRTAVRGFRTVTGGGSILWPVVEQYQVMSTAAFQVDIEETDVPTKRNVPVQIAANVTCRISPNPDEQPNAVQAFLGKQQPEIANTIKEILRGHMRTIIANLDVEEILRDRTEFNKRVLSESAEEFRRLGIQIVTLVVQDVRDSHGYIQALGKQEIAAKIRDAAIQTAEAEKDTAIKVSNAKREAAAVEAENAANIAEAVKQRNVREAQFKVQTERERAAAETAFQLAKTEQEKQLMVLQAHRDAQAAEAQIAVQEKQAALKEKELQAHLLTEAEAKRKAQVIAAEAAKEVAEREAKRLETEAEGRRLAAIKDGEGHAAKTRLESEAHAAKTRVEADAQAGAIRATSTAEADGKRAALLADAEGRRASLLAEAEGNEKKLLAEANGKKASLLAEAEGTDKLAQALKQLSEQGRLIMILDRMPTLLEKGGDAGAKMLTAMFDPMGKSLGSIKQVSIVDMGGSGTNGKSGVEKFAGSLPGMVTEFFAKAKASGVDVTPLVKFLKMDPKSLNEMLGNIGGPIVADAETSATPVESTHDRVNGKTSTPDILS